MTQEQIKAEDETLEIDFDGLICSTQMYNFGLLVAHTSDDSGIPDVGLSVGLGNGVALYAGDVPMPITTAGLKVYGLMPEQTFLVSGVARETGYRLVELIATSVSRHINARVSTLTTENQNLRAALWAMHHAVCGETGFAAAVRCESGMAYPWPALDEADHLARAALEPKP